MLKVFSNLAISLDGKIADAKAPRSCLGTPADREMMSRLRVKADVVVNGASTLNVFRCPLRVKKKPGSSKVIRQPANAIITARGDLDAEAPFWNAKDIVRFVFCPEKTLTKVQRLVRDRAFVVPCGKERVELVQVLERFKESGLNNVLVEGGGELMASFFEEKLLHELYVTLTPWILGGKNNPTLVGGSGLNDWAALELIKQKRLKNEIYLHYRVKGARRV